MSPGDRQAALSRLDAATAQLDPPFAVVDMTAFDANAAAMVKRAQGKPIRLASKSVRCRHLIERVLRLDGFRGILAYTLPEALWLAACGTSDDIVVAYPTADRAALARLAGEATAASAVAVMVDCADHLDMIEKATASVANPHPVRVAIDIDAGYVALAGRLRAGARRSPIRTPQQAVALAQAILARPGLRLAGLMRTRPRSQGLVTTRRDDRCTRAPSGTCSGSRPQSCRSGALRSSPQSGGLLRWSSSTAAAPARWRAPRRRRP